MSIDFLTSHNKKETRKLYLITPGDTSQPAIEFNKFIS